MAETSNNLTDSTNKTDKTINENEKSLISVIIRNVKGSLAKVTSYCSENNMNIERLVLSNFKTDNQLHRVIIYITGDRKRINSLIDGFKKLDVVVDASNFQANKYLERELMLIKVNSNSEYLPKISDLVNDYSGRTILVNNDITIFQFTNDEESNNELMRRLELNNTGNDVEVLKSGVVATSLNAIMTK
ncbi:MAG: acetolactate synthase small subunit [Rickettsiales bacterium]|nr:acetolactate synthase small subunit [Rickettsiales bacterium]